MQAGRGGNHTHQNATVNNSDATYTGIGNVNNIAINTHMQTDGGVTFYPPKRDVAIIETLSKFLFDNMGEKSVRMARIFAWGIGFALSASGAYSAFGMGVLTFAPNSAATLFITGFVVLGVGAVFHHAIVHRQDTRCERCRTHYSLRESADPIGREVMLSDGPHRTIDRTFACESCGHTFTRRERPDVVESE